MVVKPDKYYIEIGGVDVSTYLVDAVSGREFSKAISEGDINFNRNIKNVLTIDESLVDNLIIIKRGVDDPEERILFRGFVANIKQNVGNINIEFKDKYSIAQRRRVTTSFDRNIDPEGGKISEIFKTLLANYAPELNWSDNTIQDSGDLILLDKFECRNAELFERLDDLASVLNWQHYYDPVDDMIYFEPKGFQSDPLELEVGTNIVNNPEWEYNTKVMANVLTVNGALQAVQETQYGDGDGTEGQKVELDFTPTSVKVFVGSGSFDPDAGNKPSNSETNLLKGGKTGSTSGTFDYEYDDDQEVKTVYFFDSSRGDEPSFTPPSGTNNIEIQYTYDLPTPVFGKRNESIEKYGKWEDEITKEDIKTVDDATAYLNSYLDTFSEPLVSSVVDLVDQNTVIPGVVHRVLDPNNDIDRELLVEKVKFFLPYEPDELIVGDKDWKINNFETNVWDRLARLEEKSRKTSDLLVQVFPANVNFSTESRDFEMTKKNVAGETGIYGNEQFGVYGTAKYGSAAQSSFILGSDSFGVMGTSPLGDQSSEAITVRLIPGNNYFKEYLLDDDYFDSSASDSGVVWDTSTGEIKIPPQSYLYTTPLSIGIPYTSFTASFGSITNNTNIRADITYNNGDNWIQDIDLGTETQFPEEATKVKLRLFNTAQKETL